VIFCCGFLLWPNGLGVPVLVETCVCVASGFWMVRSCVLVLAVNIRSEIYVYCDGVHFG
jgi:hypothetical protein